jgi:Tol biopolymer transport system component
MIGQRIGPFAVKSFLGRGGMGEVYEAQDTRLDRRVALKVLPESLLVDPDRLARFGREAKVLASLQHENIASIYGLETQDDRPVLVMELAEGQDLSTRLAAGRLEPAECGKIARQLARGLEYAHEKGVVHRDLKPANIKVLGDGQVKILDFGLATAMSGEAIGDVPGSTPFQPTLTQGLTAAGTVLGTAAYMSPEQARGYAVDRRSDIWSFGVILFEMLSGERLFEGETATDTLAAILRKDPDWDQLPADADPLLVQICRRCLVRDAKRRMRDMGEVRVALEDGASTIIGHSGTGLPALAADPAGSRRLPWMVAAVLALALVAVAFLGTSGALGPKPEPERTLQTSVLLPGALRLNLNPGSPGPVRISPDGRRLAFSAIDSNGQVMLYCRDLDKKDPVAISGTIGAVYPFWSADSRSLAFFRLENDLAMVDLAGGPVLSLCRADNGKGGDWHPDGAILFAASHATSISMVPATGGEAVSVTDLGTDREFRSHRFPRWLPDGRSFLYVAVRRSGHGGGNQDSELRLASLDTDQDVALMPCQGSVEYADGHILFAHDGILMARPFDPELGAFTGPAAPVLGDVLTIQAAHLSMFAVADGGMLVYTSGHGDFGSSHLYRIDPETGADRPIYKPLVTSGLDFNPTGTMLGLAIADMQVGTYDIWLLDIARNLPTRLTFETESERVPIWSPDGQWVVYLGDQDGVSELYRKRINGTGGVEKLFESDIDCMPSDWSSDGNLIAFTTADSAGQLRINLFDLEAGEPRPLHPGVTYSEGSARFSPDGRWLAYVSEETGQTEVFVESTSRPGDRYRVSGNSGYVPHWSPAGDRLYYITFTGELFGVDLEADADGAMRFAPARRITDLVDTHIAGTYTVDPSTGDLIVLRTIQSEQTTELNLVTQWTSLLRDGVRGGRR